MSYVPKMISCEPSQAAWLEQRQINLSKFVRDAIGIAAEEDTRDISTVIKKLRAQNRALHDLVAAYSADLASKGGAN